MRHMEILEGRIRKLVPEDVLEHRANSWYNEVEFRKKRGLPPQTQRAFESFNKQVFSKLSEKLDDPILQNYIQTNMPTKAKKPKFELILTNTYGADERIITMHITPTKLKLNDDTLEEYDFLVFDTEQDAKDWALMFYMTFHNNYNIEQDF